jgi:hypothetical protein
MVAITTEAEGKAFFATAGGKKPDGIPEALQKASEIISDA